MMDKINIVTFPHPINQIRDQVSFLEHSFNELGIIYQVSNSISTAHLNILIEGFTKFSAQYIANFCKKNGVKIAVVLTEHLEIINNTLFVNEIEINTVNEYMPNAALRFQALFSLIPYIRFFMVLGHLPLKEQQQQIFKSTPIIEMPYKSIKPIDHHILGAINKSLYFSFQGSLTKYRVKMLKKIKKLSSSLSVSFDHDLTERSLTVQRSRFALQIPQNNKWRYISSMRALYCLRHGVSMLNISDHVMHEFDSIFPRISPSKLHVDLDRFLLSSHEKCYQETLDRYNAFVEKQPKSKLPAMIKLWADLDGMS